jgi:hypothetical protein
MKIKKLYAIILIAAISVAIIVPIVLLQRKAPVPLNLSILSPTAITYTSQTTQITVNLDVQGSDIDTIWYRIYNETGTSWLDANNVTWTSSTSRTLGEGGVYTLYAWVNDTAGNEKTAKVTFTMYHEIVYQGDTVFSNSVVVGLYQKMIFRSGIFRFSMGFLTVLGSLEMQDVFWDSTVVIKANSAITGTNITFSEGVQLQGNVVASLDHVCIRSCLLMYDNASMSITNVTIECGSQLFGYSNLEIHEGSVAAISVREYSKLNISCSIGASIVAYDYSSVILTNFSAPSYQIEVHGNTSLTMVNSSVDLIWLYRNFNSGTFVLDNNELSGTGSYTCPLVTLVNTTYNKYLLSLRAFGSTQLFINNSQLWDIFTYDSANLTIFNSTIPSSMFLYDNSNASIINSTSPYVYCATNGTVYFANFSCTWLYRYIVFYQGNITGYNETFVGATSWSCPKITFGPGVSYTNLRYDYAVFNQVNLTLRDTPLIDSMILQNTGNISLIRCNLVYFISYLSANVTLINSTIYYGYVYARNITLINSSVTNALFLYNSAFGSFLEDSYIALLELHHTSAFRTSDSTIADIDDYRPN